MKKYILLIAIAAGCHGMISAQQLQSSSLYDMQGLLHNASIAGVQQSSSVKGIAGVTYRQQWSGINNSPRTVTAFGSFALPQHKIGLGGFLYKDKTGPTSRTGVQLAFAKHLQLRNDAIFSLGVEARVQQYAVDMTKLSESLGSDPLLGANDNRVKFDAGFGLSYTNKNFQVGASVSQLVQSKLAIYSGSLSRSEEARLYRHYYFHANYKWSVDEETTVTPHLLVTYLPNAPVEIVGGARVEHKELLWIGAGYRSKQSWMLSAGLHIKKKFSIGYAYDIYTAPVSEYTTGHSAHELMLRYNFIK